tara:strand:+ start:55 stop:483 length:429 start_codon:yes stop_codon:yes gene_type:complete
MSLIGSFQDTALVFAEENIAVSNASQTYNFLTSRSLGPGTWLIHVDFAPLVGGFPSNDPDGYQISIHKGSSAVVEVRGHEDNNSGRIYTLSRGANLFYVHAETSSTDTFKIGYRQEADAGDGDSGGMAGRLSYHMYRLINYS